MQKEFDLDLFCKRVRLIRSNRDGERNVAAKQAIEQCEACGMAWEDALAQGFGQSDGQMTERVSELESQLAQREADTAELVQGFQEKLAAAGIKPGEHRSVPTFLHDTWGFAQCRAIILMIAMIGCMVLAHQTDLKRVTAWSIGIGLGWMFLLWATAEADDAGGYRALLLKSALLAGAIVCVKLYVDYQWVFAAGAAVVIATRVLDNLGALAMKNNIIATIVRWL